MSSRGIHDQMKSQIRGALEELRSRLLATAESQPSEDAEAIESIAAAIGKALHSDADADLEEAFRQIYTSPALRMSFIRLLEESTGDLGAALTRESSLMHEFIPRQERKWSYVCPADPSHYQKDTLLPVESLSCPLHHVPLIELVEVDDSNSE